MRRRKTLIPVALSAVAAVLVVGVLAAYGVFSLSTPSEPPDSLAREAVASKPSDVDLLATASGKLEAQETPTRAILQPTDEVKVQDSTSSQEMETELDQALSSGLDVKFEYNPPLFAPRRDSIRPIYEPEFIPGRLTSLDPEELVIGLEINGESKAYAVGPLNYRVMVNDVVGGVPVVVSW